MRLSRSFSPSWPDILRRCFLIAVILVARNPQQETQGAVGVHGSPLPALPAAASASGRTGTALRGVRRNSNARGVGIWPTCDRGIKMIGCLSVLRIRVSSIQDGESCLILGHFVEAGTANAAPPLRRRRRKSSEYSGARLLLA